MTTQDYTETPQNTSDETPFSDPAHMLALADALQLLVAALNALYRVRWPAPWGPIEADSAIQEAIEKTAALLTKDDEVAPQLPRQIPQRVPRPESG